MTENKIIIGKEEWLSLPELGLPAIKARVDSGAKTSSLHAFNIHPYEENGRQFVKFEVHPIQNNRLVTKHCTAEVMDKRTVKNTGGQSEIRPVIRTPVQLGAQIWTIEVTLTNRDSMGYRMLLGREAMQERVLVDPSVSFRQSEMNDEQAKSFYKTPKPKKGRLRILVLASNSHLYSNRRLMEAGEQRGHEMRFINVKYCYMNISALKPVVHYRGGQLLDKVDAVIPRLRPSITFYGCAVTRQFQMQGAFCLNEASAIARSRDKLRSLQMLASRGMNMPVTGFAHSPQDTKDIVSMVGGSPLVVKLLEGAQGRGVVLAETKKAAESVINAFKSIRANILVQEFIKEAGGKDIRCFVVDNHVVASIQRTAAEGDFRANLHQGGTAEAVKITSEERRMAIDAAKIMGLHVAGVDILRSSTGPKILEVNSSPGLEGVEKANQADIAALMIESIEKHILGEDRG